MLWLIDKANNALNLVSNCPVGRKREGESPGEKELARGGSGGGKIRQRVLKWLVR